MWLVILQDDVPGSCNDSYPISSHDSTHNSTKGEVSSDMEEAETPVPLVCLGMKPGHKVSCISVCAHCYADFTDI
jgi:hypothetical protein